MRTATTATETGSEEAMTVSIYCQRKPTHLFGVLLSRLLRLIITPHCVYIRQSLQNESVNTMSRLTPAEQQYLTQFLSTRASARRIWHEVSADPVQREILTQLFLATFREGWRAEQCGDSGYRLSALDPWRHPQTVTLTGVHKKLAQFCWYPDRVLPRATTTAEQVDADDEDDNFGNIVREATSAPAASKKKRRRGSDKATRFVDGRVYFGRAGGKEHGKFVHKQIKEYVDLTEEQFAALYPLGVDPMTKAALVCVEEQLGLKCLLAEQIVYDREWGIGTGLDLTCWRPTTRTQSAAIVPIEVKTGYAGGVFDQPCLRNRYLRMPYFGHISNSMLNCSRFQILLGRLLLERSLPRLPIADEFVVHVPDIYSRGVAVALGPLISACREQLIRAAERAQPL
jgi:hypothetical protein